MISRVEAVTPAARTRRDFEGLRVDIRHSVAFRELAMEGGTLIYLTLYHDEIDARFLRLLEAAGVANRDHGRMPGAAAIRRAALQVELTDALLCHWPGQGCAVVRGGSCTFPLYCARTGEHVRVSTVLPLLEDATFSRSGLCSSMAAVCHHGSYEPNAWTTTPLRGWQRIRRGALTYFDAATVSPVEEPIEQCPPSGAAPHEEAVIEIVRDAFAAYTRSQAGVESSVVELSGGYDSTLAAAAARSPGNRMRGVSVEFPYYEFRFEAPVQRAVAAAISIDRTVLDGTELFPYAPWTQPPRFDEPAVFVTGIRHAEQVAAFAAACGASRIYVGHGGDQLFAADLDGLESMAPSLSRAPYSREAWRAVRQSALPAWRRRATGCFVYDARQDVWAKENFGVTLRTPFSDNAVFRAAVQWTRFTATRRQVPDKSILARALAELLPAAVTQRKGKVAYDGVWMRAYALHGEHIARVIDQVAGVLEYIGASPVWLLERTRRLASWEPVSDREVLAGYAVAAWLLSWGIERVSEVTWVE